MWHPVNINEHVKLFYAPDVFFLQWPPKFSFSAFSVRNYKLKENGKNKYLKLVNFVDNNAIKKRSLS